MSTYRAGSGSYQQVLSATVDPSNVPSLGVTVETFNPSAFAAITADSHCVCTMPALETGLVLIKGQITATGTVTLTIWNPTNADINPASQTLQLLVL